MLEKCRNGVFKLFNIIAIKFDQVNHKFGEKIIKESPVEFNRSVEEWKKRDWNILNIQMNIHISKDTDSLCRYTKLK